MLLWVCGLKLLRRIFGVFFLLLAITLGVIFCVVSLAPGTYVAWAINPVLQDATGLHVTLRERLKLRVFPSLGVATGPVILNWADHGGRAPFQAETVELDLGILDLLQGRLAVKNVTFVSPVFRVFQSSDDPASRYMLDAIGAGAVDLQLLQQFKHKLDERVSFAPLDDFSFAILSGQLGIYHEATGDSLRIDQFDLETIMSSPSAPARLYSELRFGQDIIEVSGRMNSLESWRNTGAAQAVFELNSSLGGGNIDLNLSQLRQDGAIDVRLEANLESAAPVTHFERLLGPSDWGDRFAALNDLKLFVVASYQGGLPDIDLDLDAVQGSVPIRLSVQGRGQAAPNAFDLAAEAEVGKMLLLRSSGTASFEDASPVFIGAISAQSDSFSEFLAFLGGGGSQAYNIPIEAFSLRNAVHIQRDGCWSVSDLTMSFARSALTGEGCLDLSGPRPVWRADIAAQTLDLTPFLPLEPYERRGWQETMLPWHFLENTDALINISAGEILSPYTQTGPSKLAVGLAAGALELSLATESFGGGLELDAIADAQTRSIVVSSQARRIELGDLFDLFSAGQSPLEGTGAMRFSVSALGYSEADLIASADGMINLAIGPGAVRGINLTSRPAQNFNGGEESPRTPFSAADARFIVSSGLISAENIRLQTPALRISGTGEIDLSERSLALRFEEQTIGGAAEDTTPSAASLISGPWHNIVSFVETPSVRPSAVALPPFQANGSEIRASQIE